MYHSLHLEQIAKTPEKLRMENKIFPHFHNQNHLINIENQITTHDKRC